MGVPPGFETVVGTIFLIFVAWAFKDSGLGPWLIDRLYAPFREDN